MNREFLLHSSSDIEDQLADASGGSGVTQITVPARLDSEINPYFDKKTSCQSASSTHPPSSEITSHLIEHLLKLRAASSSSSSSAPEPEPSGSDPSAGGVRAHINSCLNDTDYTSPHNIQEVNNEASPFVDCLQNLVSNDEDDDKLFIL